MNEVFGKKLAYIAFILRLCAFKLFRVKNMLEYIKIFDIYTLLKGRTYSDIY